MNLCPTPKNRKTYVLHCEIPTIGLWRCMYWYAIRDTATYPAPKRHDRVPARVSLQSMRAVDYSMPSLIDVRRVRKVVDVLFSKASSSRKEKWFRHNFWNFSVEFESRRRLADERSRPLLLREEGCNELRLTSKGTTIDCRPTSFPPLKIVMHTKI